MGFLTLDTNHICRHAILTTRTLRRTLNLKGKKAVFWWSSLWSDGDPEAGLLQCPQGIYPEPRGEESWFGNCCDGGVTMKGVCTAIFPPTLRNSKNVSSSPFFSFSVWIWHVRLICRYRYDFPTHTVECNFTRLLILPSVGTVQADSHGGGN